MTVTDSRHRELGLTDSEYALILEKIGREPNGVELAMFSLMWSEHCGYKHSKKLLKQLPTEGDQVLVGPGENAGAVEFQDGTAVVFKVESHNHPSAVEPFQGAATGVGGILRDIFALGARPIAMLDSLRFGKLDSERSKFLLDGAVAGIGHYGNSIGVPTVGGELYFEEPYEQNCLINAMCIGTAPKERLISAAAAGPGNLVVLFGALTGRDGIGGASVLASAELGEDDQDKRPTVQIGDPFEGKKLLECSLDLREKDLLVALQDLGAAGITSSAAEMASKGSVGIEIDVDCVPLREADMEPFEVMVSESQERMLAVVAPDKLDAVLAVCKHWESNAAVVGQVTDSGNFTVLKAGEVVGSLPVDALVDDCPLYDLSSVEPQAQIYAAPKQKIPVDLSVTDSLLKLLASDNIASRSGVFERYDSLVQSRTLRRPGQADSAVLKLNDQSAVAVSIDCNGRRVACDPYWGTLWAVLECTANIACVGAKPLGLTNCLNFGNPEKPTTAWQLERSIEGLAAGCRVTDVPVVGGNVSLYNESQAGPIYPTPVVGIVGELQQLEHAGSLKFSQVGESIALVRGRELALEGSELAALRGESLPLGLAEFDAEAIVKTQRLVSEAVASGLVSSVHDVSEGGIAVALAESSTASSLGVDVVLPEDLNGELGLFGEAPGWFVVSAPSESLCELDGVLEVEVIGTVCEDRFAVIAGESKVDTSVKDLQDAWQNRF